MKETINPVKSWHRYLANYAPLSYSEMIECCLLVEKEAKEEIIKDLEMWYKANQDDIRRYPENRIEEYIKQFES